MEQKTEASQAVDDPVLPYLPRAVGYRHTMDNTESIKGNKPVTVFCATKPNPFGIPGLDYSASFPVTTEPLFTADQMKAYARAALKAQPAPTEATEKPAAHVWFHRGLLNFDGEDEMLLKLDDGKGTSIPLYLRPAATTAAAQGNTSNNSSSSVQGEDRARASAETGGVKP